jgi:hypothetical protein
MFKKNLSSRDFQKILTCETLGEGRLSRKERLEQARFAQKVRNCWFTATANLPEAATIDGFPLQGKTPSFGDAVILTDILSMVDYVNDVGSMNIPRFLLQLRSYGGQVSDGEDFFGLAAFAPQEFITKHEKNRGTLGVANELTDTQDKWLEFVPRMLRPYERIQVKWQTELAEGAGHFWFPQLGFRGVRTLKPDNPYSYLTTLASQQIQEYIAGSAPDTFFLEVQIPFASLPASGASITVKTDPMNRPLLVLGAASNLAGCQADLFDDGEYYQFTRLDAQASSPLWPAYNSPPLSLWAPDTDFRNTNLFNMWPVPHLLERSAQLRIVLTNGLMPEVFTHTFQQLASTRSSQPAIITFVCRTV